jgi:uncharacterized protein YdaU (DUF1376 family)
MSSPDVSIMTAEECGSYFFLLQWSWLGGQDCTLPNDPARLAKLARVERVSDLVLGRFVKDEQGRLYNPRLKEEWLEALNRAESSRKANEARWGGNGAESGRNASGDAGGVRAESEAESKGNPKNNYINNNKHKNKKTTSQAQVVLQPASDEALNSASPETPNPGLSEAAGRVTAKLAEILRRENLKPATLNTWAQLAGRILEKHPEQEVLAVMQWALVDSDNMFWRGRVYSMKHFAHFFGTLKQQYEIRGAGTRRAAAVDPLAARAASLQTGHDFSAIAKGDL